MLLIVPPLITRVPSAPYTGKGSRRESDSAAAADARTEKTKKRWARETRIKATEKLSRSTGKRAKQNTPRWDAQKLLTGTLTMPLIEDHIVRERRDENDTKE